MSENQAWKTTDKAWMKQRKLHFKEHVLPVLKSCEGSSAIVNRYEFRYLKAYYLKGECLAYDERWLSEGGGLPSCKALLGQPFRINFLFKIWFYPECDENYFADLARQEFERRGEAVVRKEYGNQDVDNNRLEFLDNRQHIMARLMAPRTLEEKVGPAPQDPNSARYEKGMRRWQSSMADKEDYLTHVLEQMLRCLDSRSTNFPFAFAFDLFIDLANRCDFLPDETLRNSPEKLTKKLINTLQYPAAPLELAPYNGDETLLLYKQLPELFEAGICPEIDQWWQQAKISPLEID